MRDQRFDEIDEDDATAKPGGKLCGRIDPFHSDYLLSILIS